MKKVYLVELEFNESLKGKDVIYDGSMETMLEQWMDGFVETNCINVDYSVDVKEIESHEEAKSKELTLYEQANYVLQQGINGQWKFIKHRYGFENELSDAEEFLKVNDRVLLCYANNSFKFNFEV